MITANLQGRLGNTLFQIASVMGIAVKNKLQYGFPEWKYQYAFKNQLPRCPNVNIKYAKFVEKNFHYNNYVVPDNNYLMDGYWQSWKYFEHYKEQVKQQFQFSDEVQATVEKKYGAIFGNNSNTVAVHIRRGDYTMIPDYYHILTMEHYLKAMEMFGKKFRYLVFSDEIKWCRQQDWNGYDVTFIDGNTEVVDICTMTKCNNFIIANSSFSWWGAYLGEKETSKIIAPEKWYEKGWWDEHVGQHTNDLMPTHWIKI